ncbi:MAG: ABC transporter substrate-binding protein [Candidatus Sumerlaeia bacterium]
MRIFRIYRFIATVAILLCPAFGVLWAQEADQGPKRIVSLAPSVTEVVFELDLEDRLVGVSKFCDYPEAAKELPRVGGFFDPNYEAILGLKPDLVILLTSHDEIKKRLESLGVKCLTVRHEKIPDILESIITIGKACGVETQAKTVVKQLKERTAAVVEKAENLAKVKVLMSIGRDLTGGSLGTIFAAGPDNLYDEMIGMVGGENVLADSKAAYPQLSGEGIILLKPDVIIELVGALPEGGPTVEQIRAHWDTLASLPAVKNDRVHVITGNYAVRPGPRYVQILEELARIIHPDVDWDAGEKSADAKEKADAKP